MEKLLIIMIKLGEKYESLEKTIIKTALETLQDYLINTWSIIKIYV